MVHLVLFDRIKFDGLMTRDWVIYKHPSENIRLGSTLVVGEGQVAIFVKGGQIYDSFEACTYVLSTHNLPILGEVVNFFFDNKTPFTAEIFFINLTNKLDLYWGTSDPIQLIDPKYFVKLRIRAFGQLNVRIVDHLAFFQELIGTMNASEVVQYDRVLDYFKGIIVTFIKTELANKIIREKISALEISTELTNISNSLKELLQDEFNNYGFELGNFHIQSINFPDEDFDKINEILSDRAKFEIMGDNRYITQRSFDVYEAAATNENGVAGALFAGGVGFGVGQVAAQSLPQQVSPIHNQGALIACPSCHGQITASSKFCHHCGEGVLKASVTCSACQTDNDHDARFCFNCGQNLQKRICSCGAELLPNAKFCATCGSKS